MNTLSLDPNAWDLTIDAAGNIGVASDPLSQAQDAASAIRLFSGELWYDTTKGIPYWSQILGKLPPLSLVRAKFIAAALTVPGVLKASCFFISFKARELKGQVQVTGSAGVAAASF